MLFVLTASPLAFEAVIFGFGEPGLRMSGETAITVGMSYGMTDGLRSPELSAFHHRDWARNHGFHEPLIRRPIIVAEP